MFSKDLAERNQSDKPLRDKAFKIASDPKYDGYQRGLASMVYNFFGKKSSGSGIDTSLANRSATELNYQLPNELLRKIIRQFKQQKVYSFFFRQYLGCWFSCYAIIKQMQQRNQVFIVCNCFVW